MITHIIFDLDETLYAPETGLLAHIDRRIDQYLTKKLMLDGERITSLRKYYSQRFGTTLRGVKELHGIDPDEYCSYAYAVDHGQFLTPDEDLGQMLRQIPAVKVIFSNSPVVHVEGVLRALGIRDCFRALYDIGFSNYLGKPDADAYRLVLNSLKVKGEECLFVDDQPANLKTAKRLGMTTVLIGPEKKGEADFRIASVRQLPEVWEAIGGKQAASG